jgi:hypothetical protein
MNKLKERVLRLLRTKPETRASDNILMASIWIEDMHKLEYSRSYRYIPFLGKLMNGQLTNWESATRVRRQLQAKYPELRDKETYEKRMKRSVEFKQEFSNRYNFVGRE